jgi:hypothetical protein
MLEAPDQQISLADPDARSMKTRCEGVVGYNVQTAVDVESHRHRSPFRVIADEGYYRSEELRACEQASILA